MELEVGMYVRTKDKKGITYIRKLTKLANDYPQKLYGMEVDKEIHYVNYLSQKNILKASHTLLGNEEEPCLIEEGDYVNGMEVLDADWYNEDGDYEEGLAFPMYASDDLEVIENWLPLRCVEIKSIVTKEQFSQMEYKLED